MARPAEKFEPEMFMEERVARLEERLGANVDSIKSDVTELKGDLRQLRSKTDEIGKSLTDFRLEMSSTVAALRAEAKESSYALETKIVALSVETKGLIAAFASDYRAGRLFDRIVLIMIGAGLLSVVAKAFKWI